MERTPSQDLITRALAAAMAEAVTPGETTYSDIVSAIFTLLWSVLKETDKRVQDEAARKQNASELTRVLADFMVAFGTSTTN